MVNLEPFVAATNNVETVHSIDPEFYNFHIIIYLQKIQECKFTSEINMISSIVLRE